MEITSAMPDESSVPMMYGNAPYTDATGFQSVPVTKPTTPNSRKAGMLVSSSISPIAMSSPMMPKAAIPDPPRNRRSAILPEPASRRRCGPAIVVIRGPRMPGKRAPRLRSPMDRPTPLRAAGPV